MGAIVGFIILFSFTTLLYGIFSLIYRKISKVDKKSSRSLLILGLLFLIPSSCTSILFIKTEIEYNNKKISEMGPLLHAIEKNDHSKLLNLVENTDINAIRSFVINFSYRSHTPISYATYLDNEEIVRILLEKGADPNLNLIDDTYSWTPMMHAVKNNNYSMMNLLISNGADPNKGTSSKNPFIIGLKNGDLPLVRYLHQKGAKNNHIYKKSPNTSIFLLTKYNPNTDLLNYIYENNIDIEINKYLDTTPLIKSVENNNNNNFSFRLIELGANISAKDRLGMSALHYAGVNNNYEMVKYLVEKGINFEIKNNEGETPFFYIATKSYDTYKEAKIRIKILNYLKDNGANIYTINNKKQNILESYNGKYYYKRKMGKYLKSILE